MIDGAMQGSGMISFKRFMTPEQAESIRAYIGEEARALQKTQKNDAGQSKDRPAPL